MSGEATAQAKEPEKAEILPNPYDYSEVKDAPESDDEAEESEEDAGKDDEEKLQKAEDEEVDPEKSDDEPAVDAGGNPEEKGKGKETSDSSATAAEQFKDVLDEIEDSIPDLSNPDDYTDDVRAFHKSVKENIKRLTQIVREVRNDASAYRNEAQDRREKEAVAELDAGLAELSEFHAELGATRSERLKNPEMKKTIEEKLIPRIRSIAREYEEAKKPVPSLRQLTREAAESLFPKKTNADLKALKNQRVTNKPGTSNANRRLTGRDRALQRSRELDGFIGDNDGDTGF